MYNIRIDMKRISGIILVILTGLTAALPAFIAVKPVWAQEDKVGISVFVREGCSHCQAEENFLDGLTQLRKDIYITYYRLENTSDRAIWDRFTTRLELSKITPITVIGKYYILVFGDDAVTGKQILKLIEETKTKGTVTDIEFKELTLFGAADTG